MSQHIYTYDPTNDQLNEIGGAGHVIKNESGTSFAKRENLQFNGMKVEDDSTNNSTIVSAVETNFVGTYAEWQALSLAERAQYKTVDLTDDFNGGPIDSVPTKDSPNPVSSGGVYSSLSNPNLLDNPWFTVNQRGQSSYTNSSGGIYTVDRWRLSNTNNDGNVTVNSNKSITLTGGTSTAFLENRFEKDIFPFEFYKGKAITVSVLYGDGTLKSATKNVPTDKNTDWELATELLYDSTIGGARFYYRHTNGSPLFAQIEAFSGESVTVKAMKVELGSISTLAMDAAPNYATELLKCQRYFWRKTIGNGISFGSGFAPNTTTARISIILPVIMRTTPTLTTDVTTALDILQNDTVHKSTAVTNASMRENDNIVCIHITTTGLTVNGLCIGKAGSQITHLDFSADL